MTHLGTRHMGSRHSSPRTTKSRTRVPRARGYDHGRAAERAEAAEGLSCLTRAREQCGLTPLCIGAMEHSPICRQSCWSSLPKPRYISINLHISDVATGICSEFGSERLISEKVVIVAAVLPANPEGWLGAGAEKYRPRGKGKSRWYMPYVIYVGRRDRCALTKCMIEDRYVVKGETDSALSR